MGLFDKHRNADIVIVRQSIEESDHVLQVTAVKHWSTKIPKEASTIEDFVAEFKVIATKPMKEDREAGPSHQGIGRDISARTRRALSDGYIDTASKRSTTALERSARSWSPRLPA